MAVIIIASTDHFSYDIMDNYNIELFEIISNYSKHEMTAMF
jgi:hypothetical protein